MNSQGECRRPNRKADRVSESLAREVQELQERELAHLAALRILRERLERVEALCDTVEAAPVGWGGDMVVSLARSVRGAMTFPTERPPVPCIYCGLEHDNGTACPPLEFPGTEWDQ